MRASTWQLITGRDEKLILSKVPIQVAVHQRAPFLLSVKSVAPAQTNLPHVSNDHYPTAWSLCIPSELRFPFLPRTAVTHLLSLYSTAVLLCDCNGHFKLNFIVTTNKLTIVSFKFCISDTSVKYTIKTQYITNDSHFFYIIFQKYQFKLLNCAYYCVILAAQHAIIHITMLSCLVEVIASKTHLQ